MQTSNKPRAVGRFILLSCVSVLGAIAFLPSILASTQPPPPLAQLSVFVLVVSAVCIASAWFGLRCADAVHLPMPFLRRLDMQSETSRGNGVVPAIVCGGIFAAGAIYFLHYFHQPNLAGSLASRIASVLFAAGDLEIVIHLFIMSLAVWLTRGKVWVGILVATAFFIAFHTAGALGQSAPLIAGSILLNGGFGLLLGIFYARYGLEYVMLSHAVGHVLAVTLA